MILVHPVDVDSVLVKLLPCIVLEAVHIIKVCSLLDQQLRQLRREIGVLLAQVSVVGTQGSVVLL